MQEILNRQEKVLLDFLKSHYRSTYEVIFTVPETIYEKTEIKDEITLNKFLTALCVRGYIAPNKLTEQNQMVKEPIMLTEKSLNRFN